MTSGSSVIGCVGKVLVATRGTAGVGEVLVSVRGGTEAYLAWSDEPLPRGTIVLVVDERGARTVDVVPWNDTTPWNDSAPWSESAPWSDAASWSDPTLMGPHAP